MRVAMIIDLFYPYQLGGAERQFFELAKRLVKRHEIHVFTLKLRGCKPEERYHGINIHRVGIPHPLHRRSIISLLSFYPFVLFSLLKNFRRFDVIHANQAAALLSFFLGISTKPFIATIHDLYLNRWREFRAAIPLLGRMLEFLICRGKYALVLTVSAYSAKKLLNCGMKNIVIVPNGIELKKFKGRMKKEDRVVYLGRLVRYKHVDTLIRAAKLVQERMKGRDVKLVIIGEGEERRKLEKLAEKLRCNCEFLGFVSEKRKIRELKRAKIFCSLSSIEGFGISLLEAFASGTAAVVRDLPCYREFAPKNCAIFLSNKEADDPKIVAEKIIKLLTDKHLAKKYAESARKLAKHYDWDKIASYIEKIYERAARSAGEQR